jgi:NADPH-dependent stearoyl-CoA 9-desaturase
VVGRDPDITSDMFRLSERVPWRVAHALQLPLLVLLVIPNFGFLLNLHYAGFNPAYREQDAGWHRAARIRALRKYLRHYGKEYLLYPLLAGPFAPKVAFGNWLSALCADVYTALTNYCGHLQGAPDWPADAKTAGRGDYYRTQVESTMNFEVNLPVSILCGALDRQIEHHLYPRLPPNRLREIAPEVRRVCETYGVRYRTSGWGSAIRAVFRHVSRLASAEPADA